ncbi:hypothetical protein AVEN_117685-1 [Araneus ventricosus]|uniref:Histone-lysine N-methyltransferase SETMAR n=1 Tax=Araneus ventricosus TaxID=182803 RepID=A0A4Y2P482_ARAVE|nr:hypothetical protein AVEN_117685-1 [Araneus ventricosus]
MEWPSRLGWPYQENTLPTYITHSSQEHPLAALRPPTGLREGFCSWMIMQDPTQERTHSSAGMGEIVSPTYSPDLDLSDFHPFFELEATLSGGRYRSNEEVRKAVKNFLLSLGSDFYQDGFLKLISRFDKRINVGGDYVEK